MSGGGVTLRPLREDDAGFIADLYASTREEELAVVPFSPQQKAAFLAQQLAAQTAHYTTRYAGAAFDVILVDGERAGRLIVDRGEREITVVDIALLPGYRGRGAGTLLLRSIFEEADDRALPVTVHVERANPAQRLYERLGFVPVEDLGVYLRLERRPGGQAKIAS